MKLGIQRRPRSSMRRRRGAGKGVSQSSTASVVGSTRPIRFSLSWLNQTPPSGAMSMPYGTGRLNPPPDSEPRSARCPSTQSSAGSRRSTISWPSVRSGKPHVDLLAGRGIEATDVVARAHRVPDAARPIEAQRVRVEARRDRVHRERARGGIEAREAVPERERDPDRAVRGDLERVGSDVRDRGRIGRASQDATERNSVRGDRPLVATAALRVETQERVLGAVHRVETSIRMEDHVVQHRAWAPERPLLDERAPCRRRRGWSEPFGVFPPSRELRNRAGGIERGAQHVRERGAKGRREARASLDHGGEDRVPRLAGADKACGRRSLLVAVGALALHGVLLFAGELRHCERPPMIRRELRGDLRGVREPGQAQLERAAPWPARGRRVCPPDAASAQVRRVLCTLGRNGEAPVGTAEDRRPKREGSALRGDERPSDRSAGRRVDHATH